MAKSSPFARPVVVQLVQFSRFTYKRWLQINLVLQYPNMADSSTQNSSGSSVRRQEAFAALDLGTNNCRLLVAVRNPSARGPSESLRVIDSFSRIVRLGEDVGETGELSEAAMERTMAALMQCRKKLERHPGAHARFVATEACRRAGNAKAFLKRVKEETGLSIEIISGEEEAKLAFIGCSSLLSTKKPRALVFDIGGGSTEFLWVKVPKTLPPHGMNVDAVQSWLSLPLGVMNLSERFGGHAYTEMYFEEIVERLVKSLKEFDRAYRIGRAIKNGEAQMLSTSGTVTTLTAVQMGLPRYDRAKVDGSSVSIRTLCKTVQLLLSMSPAERKRNPCIGPERADYLLSGCAIFQAICQLWPVGKITVADRGVREGIILSLMQQETA